MTLLDRTNALPDLWNAPYLCGIGGIGVSGVALLLLDLGMTVTGSDLRRSEITDMLEIRGVKIAYEPSPDRVSKASVLITPTSFPPKHPEILEARKRAIPILTRTQALAQLCTALGGHITLCFGTTARAKLARFAKYLPHTGWCSGAACTDGTPHAKIRNSMFLDLDEREFFEHPELWQAFPHADVVIADWQKNAHNYYSPQCTLNSFLEQAKQRPSPGCTLFPIHDSPDEFVFKYLSHETERDYRFYLNNGMLSLCSQSLLDPILPKGIRYSGTYADAGALAAAVVWFHEHGITPPYKDIRCIGWFNRLHNGQYHDIRMHPVNIRIALETLQSYTPNAPIFAAIKPFASTLFAYSPETWANIFKSANQLYIITPPYEGCTDEDCFQFCSQLMDNHISAQCVTVIQAKELAKDKTNWIWIGAPDLVNA